MICQVKSLFEVYIFKELVQNSQLKLVMSMQIILYRHISFEKMVMTRTPHNIKLEEKKQTKPIQYRNPMFADYPNYDFNLIENGNQRLTRSIDAKTQHQQEVEMRSNIVQNGQNDALEQFKMNLYDSSNNQGNYQNSEKKLEPATDPSQHGNFYYANKFKNQKQALLDQNHTDIKTQQNKQFPITDNQIQYLNQQNDENNFEPQYQNLGLQYRQNSSKNQKLIPIHYNQHQQRMEQNFDEERYNQAINSQQPQNSYAIQMEQNMRQQQRMDYGNVKLESQSSKSSQKRYSESGNNFQNRRNFQTRQYFDNQMNKLSAHDNYDNNYQRPLLPSEKQMTNEVQTYHSHIEPDRLRNSQSTQTGVQMINQQTNTEQKWQNLIFQLFLENMSSTISCQMTEGQSISLNSIFKSNGVKYVQTFKKDRYERPQFKDYQNNHQTLNQIIKEKNKETGQRNEYSTWNKQYGFGLKSFTAVPVYNCKPQDLNKDNIVNTIEFY